MVVVSQHLNNCIIHPANAPGLQQSAGGGLVEPNRAPGVRGGKPQVPLKRWALACFSPPLGPSPMTSPYTETPMKPPTVYRRLAVPRNVASWERAVAPAEGLHL